MTAEGPAYILSSVQVYSLSNLNACFQAYIQCSRMLMVHAASICRVLRYYLGWPARQFSLRCTIGRSFRAAPFCYFIPSRWTFISHVTG